MYNSINRRIDELKNEIIGSLQRLIMIKSVKSNSEKGKPFGDSINDSLETILNIAELMGLNTENFAGYAGHIEIGNGDELVGVLCHLDVVPEGKNWTYPPYGGEIHDKKIYGRGSIDNKGPAIAVLYALKAILDCGIDLNKRVRLILGTDEENDWEGLKYYLANEESPDLAFSPDAEFPVIQAEKGILVFKLIKELKGNNKKEEDKKVKGIVIEGGNAPNMVPDYCEAIFKTDFQSFIKDKLNNFLKIKPYHMETQMEENGITIKSFGKSAHGSLPEKGKNAISQLMSFLKYTGLFTGEILKYINFYDQKIGMEYNGKSFNCGLVDDESGNLTFNVGMIKVDSDIAEITVDVRYPVTYKKEEVKEKIKRELEGTDIKYQEINYKKPLYVSEDEPLVQKLMMVYNEYTNENREPVAIGGGTYARVLEKAIAFGPIFPGQKELAHQTNEFISIDNLIKITKIYAAAIINLSI